MTKFSLSQIVGANTRAIRTESGVTLDALASSAKSYGLKWTTARVVELENGRLSVGIPVLLILAQSLGDLAGRRVSIPELLESDGWVQLNEKLAVSADSVQSAFSGVAVNWTMSDVEGGVSRANEIVTRALKRADERSDALPAAITAFEVEQAANVATGLAEERAARKLGVDVVTLNAHGLRLWGKSFSERRDEIAAEATPQARGHASRVLLGELRKSIDQARDNPNG